MDGVDSTPIDAIVPDAVCEYYTLDNPAPEGTTCHVVRGMMTLYLRESDPASSALQSSSGALKAIRDAMNGDVSPGPFSGGGGGPYAVDGVMAVRYVRGSPDEGLDAGGFGGDFGDGSAAGGGGSNANGAAAEVDAAASASSQSPISAGGIWMIAIGAIAMFGVLLVGVVVAVRRKRGDGRGDDGGGRVGGGPRRRRRILGRRRTPNSSTTTTTTTI